LGKSIPHRAQILCLNFIKYYSSWLHVSSRLSLLDDYFIMRKYNEINHRDRAQILCLNFIKYYSSWLHVSSQLSLLDDYFIMGKYNELNHRDPAQILCLNFIKYYSSWLHVSSQLSLYWTITSLWENTMSSITVTVHKSFVSTSFNIIHPGCTFHLSYPYWTITSLWENTMSSITVTVHKVT
jgi:hypothetical protein